MKSWLVLIACLTSFWNFQSLCKAADKQFSLGKKVEQFELKDFRGKVHRLAEIETPLIVVAFLGTECPLVKLYGPRLNDLQQRYQSRGVTFLAVNSNVQDSVTEIAAYARKHNIAFPILKDLGNDLADQMGAERTPQVFILDEQRTICYMGRIDDQYGVGYVREQPKRHDLAVALDELLAGKAVSTSLTVAPGCRIGRQREPVADAKVTYSNRIAHIMQDRCVECHREGDIAPFAFQDYDEVAGWGEMIEEVVREQRMPPWHANPKHGEFINERLLSEDEKRDIYQWVADGAPEGNPAELPKPREFVTGWQLPKQPDDVFTIQPEPFEVQAEGEIAYKWFEVDLDYDEDRWVSGVEILPGNRAVVHHILAFVRDGKDNRKISGDRGFFAGYVPGLRAKLLPPGMAKLLPAGSKLAFQMHYTPVGSVQFDQSKIGLVFADREDVTHRAISTSAINERLQIPPHDDNFRVEADSPRIPWDSEILSMSPHMHLRGKAFSYEAVLPDGTKRTLLDVPRYDFNWQTEYRLTESIKLPADSRIHAVAHFDNSDGNLNNPNPNVTVHWGDQTWDEMMIGYFLVAIPIDTPLAMPEANLRSPEQAAKVMDKRIGRMFRKADADGDGQITIDEAPPLLKAGFSLTDTDASGDVTLEEFSVAVKQYFGQR